MSKRAGFIIIFLILLLLLPSISKASEFQVGVSPLVLDAGEFQRGSSNVLTFYIVTSSEDEMLVRLEAFNGNINFFNKPDYKNLIYNYSEEDASKWVKFIDNPATLKSTEGVEMEDGRILTGFREINFILDVPEDAEPGYHTIVIKPTPYTPSGGGGVNILAIVAMTVLFKVEGDGIRDGKIMDIEAGQPGRSNTRLNVFFKNTGTVTISPQAFNIEIYNDSGDVIKKLKSNIEYLKPGEMNPLVSYFTGLDLGEYKVHADVDFRTGQSSKNSTITLQEMPSPMVIVKPEEQAVQLPWVMIAGIFIFIIMFYIIYRRD